MKKRTNARVGSRFLMISTVIFLHTMGSHHHAQKRYPESQKYFAEDYQDECNSDMDPSCAEYVIKSIALATFLFHSLTAGVAIYSSAS